MNIFSLSIHTHTHTHIHTSISICIFSVTHIQYNVEQTLCEDLVNFKTERISWPARLESAVVPCRPFTFIVSKMSSKMEIKTKSKIKLTHLVKRVWLLNSLISNKQTIYKLYSSEKTVHRKQLLQWTWTWHRWEHLYPPGVTEKSNQTEWPALQWSLLVITTLIRFLVI